MTAPQIKRLRTKTLMLSQEKFAKLVGVARRTAQGWEGENSRHRPSAMAIKRLNELAAAAEDGPP